MRWFGIGFAWVKEFINDKVESLESDEEASSEIDNPMIFAIK